MSQFVMAEAPSEAEIIKKLEKNISSETFETAKAYLDTLKKEDFEASYSKLASIFKNEITKEKYTEAIKQLHNTYGRPKNGKIIGGLFGQIRTKDGSDLTAQTILFNSVLINNTGEEIGALIKITILADENNKPSGVLRFLYIPKSNIQYKGTYKLPKENDS